MQILILPSEQLLIRWLADILAALLTVQAFLKAGVFKS